MRKDMRKRLLVILYVLLVLLLAFIWGNSLLPRTDSTAESEAIGGIITPILEIFVGKGNVTDHLVRKLAHFTEYAALGLVLSCISRLHRRISCYDFISLIFAGCFVAAIDEGIQLFSDGRGSQVSDVLLDTSGAATGVLILGAIACAIGKAIISHRKNQS